MNRYYFDMRDGNGAHNDDFGDMFHSVEEAEQQALTLLWDTAPGHLQQQERFVTICRVRDGRGLVIYQAKMVAEGKRFPNGIEAWHLDDITGPVDGSSMRPDLG